MTKQIILGLLLLVLITIIAGGAYHLGKQTKQKPTKVYILSQYKNPRRNQILEVVHAYLANIETSEKFSLTFFYQSNFLTTNNLLDHLENSSHIAAESPLFVYFDRPFAEQKKQLRAAIENAFSGEARKTIFKSVVPILDLQFPEQTNLCAQLENDVLYSVWNFGGFALKLDETGIDKLKICTDKINEGGG